jgi:hypothetical protein
MSLRFASLWSSLSPGAMPDSRGLVILSGTGISVLFAGQKIRSGFTFGYFR